MQLLVRFGAKTQPAQYQSREACIELTDDLGIESDQVTVELARNQFAKLKAEVFDQLGIGYELDAEGIVREHDAVESDVANLQAGGLAPVAVVSNVAPYASGPPAAAPVGVVPPPPVPVPPSPAASTAAGYSTQQLIQLYQQDPNQWWDNRTSKKNPKAPDFAHKTLTNDKGFKLGLWMSDFEKYAA